MILDRFSPDSLPALCEQLSGELARLRRELACDEQRLQAELPPQERKRVERLQVRRGRRLELLHERLEMLNGARYNDEPRVVWDRILDLV